MNNYVNSKTLASSLFLLVFFLFNGNSSYGQNNLMISGQITTEYGRGIPNTIIGTDTSDANGNYTINTMVSSGNLLTFSLKKETNPLNGISTEDLIGISKHILSVESTPSPYRLLAADVNRNGLISTFDLVIIQKMLLQQNIDSTKYGWGFIRTNFIFPDPSNPFSTTIPQEYSVNSPDTLSNFDFIGFKLGDYTGNAAPNLFVESEDRSYTDEFNFSIADQQIQSGETREIFLRTEKDLELNGFQFSLQYDTEALEVIDVQSTAVGLKETHAGMSQIGKIHLLAYQSNEKAIKAEDALIKLRVRAKRDLTLSQVLQIGTSHLQPEIYQSNKEAAKLNLEYKAIPTTTNITSPTSVYPNPFLNQTTLSFHVPAKGLVTLTITDQLGRLISQQSQFMQTGNHQWLLSAETLSTEKLLFYRLEGPDLKTTGRLIRQK